MAAIVEQFRKSPLSFLTLAHDLSAVAKPHAKSAQCLKRHDVKGQGDSP